MRDIAGVAIGIEDNMRHLLSLIPLKSDKNWILYEYFNNILSKYKEGLTGIISSTCGALRVTVMG